MGDFLETTDDSGELMDTFHLFGDESAAGEDRGGQGEGATAGEEVENGEGGGEVAAEGASAGAGRGGLGAAAGGQSVAKLKTLDGEAFCSCLEMCFEHMVRIVIGVLFCWAHV